VNPQNLEDAVDNEATNAPPLALSMTVVLIKLVPADRGNWNVVIPGPLTPPNPCREEPVSGVFMEALQVKFAVPMREPDTKKSSKSPVHDCPLTSNIRGTWLSTSITTGTRDGERSYGTTMDDPGVNTIVLADDLPVVIFVKGFVIVDKLPEVSDFVDGMLVGVGADVAVMVGWGGALAAVKIRNPGRDRVFVATIN